MGQQYWVRFADLCPSSLEKQSYSIAIDSIAHYLKQDATDHVNHESHTSAVQARCFNPHLNPILIQWLPERWPRCLGR